ncbi:hypothetical protein ORI89_02715 [Sphingobacterium sp. UT-1RO-CII-1]|uniref:IS630 transposase-related protein n=1 Tax=Sphingobacterium sp. UT-1RO-CII-1 TaxID=2995225 RepID=UPI002279FACE|nr:IS630 transposase-related protein [Sphingobacterium sp. UT-1RO-CII-1]MCY4778547.1 hypothetical protein [Sphingobacterium sp. UT-1RO-CII-1]
MKYEAKLREKVVLEIVDQGIFIEEIMQKYDIKTRSTIVRWLKDHLAVCKDKATDKSSKKD